MLWVPPVVCRQLRVSPATPLLLCNFYPMRGRLAIWVLLARWVGDPLLSDMHAVHWPADLRPRIHKNAPRKHRGLSERRMPGMGGNWRDGTLIASLLGRRCQSVFGRPISRWTVEWPRLVPFRIHPIWPAHAQWHSTRSSSARREGRRAGNLLAGLHERFVRGA
jgi:hypothetical protein